MSSDIRQWVKQYPEVIKRLDGIKYSGGTTGRTHQLSGKFQHQGKTYSQAILKYANDTELRFYLSTLYQPDLAPIPFIIDKDKQYILMEYLEPCPVWDNSRILSKVFKKLLTLYQHPVPDWIKPQKLIPANVPIKALSQVKLQDDHMKSLHKAIELVEQAKDRITQEPYVINHGDIHFVNTGIRGEDLLIYDWQTLRSMPMAYEFAYTFYVLNERRDHMPTEQQYYSWFYQATGMSLDRDLCRILYLYRSIYDHIPIYVKAGDSSRMDALHYRTPVIARRINEWYKTQR